MSIINSLKDAFANLGKTNYGDASRPYYQLEQPVETAECPKKEYDPEGDDKLTERVVRQVEAGLL